MTRKSWDKLKKGSVIKSAKRGIKRLVINANGHGCITLVMISGGIRRGWRGGYHNMKYAGVDTTVYCAGDKKYFEVVRY